MIQKVGIHYVFRHPCFGFYCISFTSIFPGLYDISNDTISSQHTRGATVLDGEMNVMNCLIRSDRVFDDRENE